MRPSASLCQCSRYRLLTLLPVLLLGILCDPSVGKPTPGINFSHHLNSSNLPGGEPLTRNYSLNSQCKGNVQIRPLKGRKAVSAVPMAHGYELLTFTSISPTELTIEGVKARRFLCFNKRGTLVARFNGNRTECRFHQHSVGGFIMLQSAARSTWYVGFNKRGKSKPGFSFPAKGEKGGRSNKPNPNKRGRNRGRGKKRKCHDRSGGVPIRHNKGQRKRGCRKRVRKRKDILYQCFQFVKKPTEEDESDPRVRNKLTQKKNGQFQNLDLSSLTIAPDPR